MTYDTIENALKTNQPAVIIKETPYNHLGNDRLSIKARKAKGKRVYTVVKYENGRYSTAV